MRVYVTANSIAQPDLKEHVLGMLNSIFVEDDLGNKYLMNMLGGNVYVAENRQDVNLILSQLCEGEPEWVCKGAYREHFICNNNAGGPTYYIPNDLFGG